MLAADRTTATIAPALGENLSPEGAVFSSATRSLTTLVTVPLRLTIAILPWLPRAIEFGRYANVPSAEIVKTES